MDSQMNDQICKVCGQPLAAHVLTLNGGVAHTAMTINGKMRYCSQEDSMVSWHLAVRGRLSVTIRSLRYRAGRLNSANGRRSADNIRAYADMLAQDRERIDTIIAEDFSWWRS
jgi:hypothetical protein